MQIKRLFAREEVSNKELREAFGKMNQQIKAVGGQLTFLMKIDNEGWAVRCKEFDGIVAGGKNRNPSEEEVIQSIIDSIKTAFNVPIRKIEIREIQPELPKITVVRELQFC